jgi:inhibitor of KinA
MLNQPGYTIFPLGDCALTVDFGNRISEDLNKKVIALFNLLQQHPVPGIVEAVPAYSSLTCFYDPVAVLKNIQPGKSVFDRIRKKVEELLEKTPSASTEKEKLIRMPVCYETTFGPDLMRISELKKMAAEEIIRLHTSVQYRVYMIGFLPGFPYLGEVDERIIAPRKNEPVTVKAGSVGIAGKQTGIYPLDSPGGWQIIGRTPLKIFNKEKENPVLLKAGDRVEFYSVTMDEFEKYNEIEQQSID